MEPPPSDFMESFLSQFKEKSKVYGIFCGLFVIHIRYFKVFPSYEVLMLFLHVVIQTKFVG